MSNETALTPSIGVFIKRRLILSVIDTVKSGKEATVYRCRAHPDTKRIYLAVKVHRPVDQRAFTHDAIYHHGRVIIQGRMARAFTQRSRYGIEVRSMTWVRAEVQTLRLLKDHGALVPEVISHHDRAILMEWIGDEEPAPMLISIRLDRWEAERCLDLLLSQVALWLSLHRVHGDLSGFNILYHHGQPVIIDVPQSVDPRSNANAHELLRRDLKNLAHCFVRFGVDCDHLAIADDLWQQWLRARDGGDWEGEIG
jgi:RIO kinase 1